MNQVQLRGKNVAVEKLTKQADKGMFTMPETSEFFGLIIYVGTDAAKDLKVGQQVYFGTQYQQSRIANKNLCVMEDSNVLAVLSEKSQDADSQT